MAIFNSLTTTECLLFALLLVQLMLILLTILYISAFFAVALIVSFIAFLVGIAIMAFHRMAVRKESHEHQLRWDALNRRYQAALLENLQLSYAQMELSAENQRLGRTIRGQQNRWEGVQMEENFVAL